MGPQEHKNKTRVRESFILKKVGEYGAGAIVAVILAVVGMTTKSCHKTLEWVIEHAKPHSAPVDPKLLPPGVTIKPEPKIISVNALTMEEWREKATHDPEFVMANFKLIKDTEYVQDILSIVIKKAPDTFFDIKYYPAHFIELPYSQEVLENMDVITAFQHYGEFSVHPYSEKIMEKVIDSTVDRSDTALLSREMFQFLYKSESHAETNKEYRFMLQCLPRGASRWGTIAEEVIYETYPVFINYDVGRAEIYLDMAVRATLDKAIEDMNKINKPSSNPYDYQNVNGVVSAAGGISSINRLFAQLIDYKNNEQYPIDKIKNWYKYLDSRLNPEILRRAQERSKSKIDFKKIRRDLRIP